MNFTKISLHCAGVNHFDGNNQVFHGVVHMFIVVLINMMVLIVFIAV
jgi:hypothetical protein